MFTPLSVAVTHADTAAAGALGLWGADAQAEKAIEEMGELLVALGRRRFSASCQTQARADLPDIVEECADVIVAVLSVARAYSSELGNIELADKIMAKATRLVSRVNAELDPPESFEAPRIDA